MNPPQSAAGWLAANLDGLTLTAWTVTDGAPAPAQVLQLPDGSPAALAAELVRLDRDLDRTNPHQGFCRSHTLNSMQIIGRNCLVRISRPLDVRARSEFGVGNPQFESLVVGP